MTRENMAAFAAHQTAFWQSLHADAEAEAAKLREEAIQLRAALASREGQLQDQTAAIFALMKERDEEQRRRSKFQAVDAAARRFAACVIEDYNLSSEALALLKTLQETIRGGVTEDRSSVTGMSEAQIDILRGELQSKCAREDRSRSDVVTDVIFALRERGLLRGA